MTKIKKFYINGVHFLVFITVFLKYSAISNIDFGQNSPRILNHRIQSIKSHLIHQLKPVSCSLPPLSG